MPPLRQGVKWHDGSPLHRRRCRMRLRSLNGQCKGKAAHQSAQILVCECGEGGDQRRLRGHLIFEEAATLVSRAAGDWLVADLQSLSRGTGGASTQLRVDAPFHQKGRVFERATGLPRPLWEKPSPPTNYASDILNFAAFAPLGAPPAPVPDTSSIAKGRHVLTNVGYGACHIQQHTTEQSTYIPHNGVLRNWLPDAVPWHTVANPVRGSRTSMALHLARSRTY
jgi:hypothetical protein